MFLRSLPMVFVLSGVVLYTVLGGADFGAGFWQLPTGRRGNTLSVREHAHHSMGPVWEANHVWLIFVLTVFWTAYPRAFGSIASTLAVPLFIAAIGIIFRGLAYALRAGAASARESAAIDSLFSISSVLAPFALGAAIGAIATNRVPVGNAAGHLFSSWLNGTSVFIGILAVTGCAYLAAVYLAADAVARGESELEHEFRLRALAMGVIAGGVALGGLVVVHHGAHALYVSLTHGAALIAVIASALAGAGALGLVYTRRYEPARYVAAAAVALVVVAWAIGRWPEILPGLTIDQAAAGHETLVWVLVAVIAGGVILFPSLALLFTLTLTHRLDHGPEEPASAFVARSAAVLTERLLVRAAAALLIAGVGLLNLADAKWAHLIGVLCLLGFIITAFLAIVPAALPPPDGARSS